MADVSEKEIEDAFCEYVNGLDSIHGHNEVFGRQVRLFDGIADVIGVLNECWVFVAEIKRGVIDEKACTQLLGYTEQVNIMISSEWEGNLTVNRNVFNRDIVDLSRCTGVLVGTSLSRMAERLVVASGMIFFRYAIEGNNIDFFRTNMGYGYWTDDTPTASRSVIGKVIDAIKHSYHIQRES